VQSGTVRWHKTGKTSHAHQHIIACPATDWARVAATNAYLATWSVLTFKSGDIIAISPEGALETLGFLADIIAQF
jgi:hypothetical protein